MTLKEDIEQLAAMDEIFYETPERQKGFSDDIYDFLRRFVEECCNEDCAECADDWGVKGPDCEGVYWHVAEPEAGGNKPCAASNLRDHFAWLGGE